MDEKKKRKNRRIFFLNKYSFLLFIFPDQPINPATIFHPTPQLLNIHLTTIPPPCPAHKLQHQHLRHKHLRDPYTTAPTSVRCFYIVIVIIIFLMFSGHLNPRKILPISEPQPTRDVRHQVRAVVIHEIVDSVGQVMRRCV